MPRYKRNGKPDPLIEFMINWLLIPAVLLAVAAVVLDLLF